MHRNSAETAALNQYSATALSERNKDKCYARHLLHFYYSRITFFQRLDHMFPKFITFRINLFSPASLFITRAVFLHSHDKTPATATARRRCLLSSTVGGGGTCRWCFFFLMETDRAVFNHGGLGGQGEPRGRGLPEELLGQLHLHSHQRRPARCAR